MEYELERFCKNSIRYKKIDIRCGPVTIYMPNEMFDDPTNPPKILIVEITEPES